MQERKSKVGKDDLYISIGKYVIRNLPITKANQVVLFDNAQTGFVRV